MRPALALVLVPLVLGAGCSSDSSSAGADTAGGDIVDTVNIDAPDTDGSETVDLDDTAAPADGLGDLSDGDDGTGETVEADTSPPGDVPEWWATRRTIGASGRVSPGLPTGICTRSRSRSGARATA